MIKELKCWLFNEVDFDINKLNIFSLRNKLLLIDSFYRSNNLIFIIISFNSIFIRRTIDKFSTFTLNFNFVQPLYTIFYAKDSTDSGTEAARPYKLYILGLCKILGLC